MMNFLKTKQIMRYSVLNFYLFAQSFIIICKDLYMTE